MEQAGEENNLNLDWDQIDTILLDLDGTLLDLNFDLEFWLKYIPEVYSKKNNIGFQYAKEIVISKGLMQITDSSAIESLVDKILQLNSKQVEQYKNGKEKVFGFLVGQVMKETKGQANPNLVNELLKEKIDLM